MKWIGVGIVLGGLAIVLIGSWLRKRGTMNHKFTCDARGPDVRVSPQFVRPARCNRVSGHVGEHAERNPHSFAVVAKWRDTREERTK